MLLFSHLVESDSVQPHGLQHARLSCPSPSPRVCLNSCPLSQWCHPTISLSCPLLLPSIFASIRVYSNELAICIRGQTIGASASASALLHEYSLLISFRIGWFDLLAVQGLSSVFSSTTVQKHQFFNAQPSLGFTNTSVSKNLPAMQETPVQFLSQEDPLEKGKATHSSILAWRIPRTIKFMWSQRVGHH